MKKMPLEHRGITNSRLVLGCMPFGGGWNQDPITDEHLINGEQAVDAALSIGITMFDHADIYTMGKAEKVFGHILRKKPELREQIIIQSKCGIRFPEDSAPHRFDFSKEHILNSVDGILDRLGTEYLDVLLLHRPDPLVEPDEVAEAFSKLKLSGKVKNFGVSNMSVSQIRFLQQALPDQIVVNQLEMNLAKLDWLNQDVHVNQEEGVNVHFSEGLMEHCQIEKIQIQAWSPLAKGKFSGRSVDEETENIRNTAAMVKEIAVEKGTTQEAIVLGWLMKHPAMIQPVIGTANPERIIACKDAEIQSQMMSREEWYSLYESSKGRKMP